MSQYNNPWTNFGQAVAWAYFKKADYKILANNWHYHHQKIDLVAQQQSTIVFIEIKLYLTNKFSRTNKIMGGYHEKQLQIAANYFLPKYKINKWRYDFVVISINGYQGLAKLKHYRQITPSPHYLKNSKTILDLPLATPYSGIN